MSNEISSSLAYWLFVIPAGFSLIVYLAVRWHRTLGTALALVGAFIPLAISALICWLVLPGIVVTAWARELRIDGLSCLLILLISGVGFLATVFSVRYMSQRDVIDRVGPEIAQRRSATFYGLMMAFIATMLWGCATNNIIMLYVAVEASTIASGLLVAFFWDRRALEAGYKYLMLLTVGITFALFGCVLIYSAATRYLVGVDALLIDQISQVAALLPRSIVVFAVALFIVGFGTKAGVAPFHPWLPDAHAEAPTPVSALLSGVMIKMAAYALTRVVVMFYPSYPPIATFIVVLGVFTMILGGLMALAQDDLKRLLAYSSVSQMGYILMGVGLGTYLGIYGGLFHLLNHGIYKALLFLSTGAVIYAVAQREISQLGGLARKMPVTAACFLIGALSISGLPPFNGFMSKLTIYLAGAEIGMWWAVILAIFTSLLTMIVLIRAGYRVFWGELKAGSSDQEGIREAPASILIPMIILAGLCVVLGVYPQLAYPLLDQATKSVVAVLGGG